MAEARELFLLRHGETEGSLAHLYSGQADVPLTARGREQARVAGARLAEAGVDAILSSPLSRAAETADEIGAATGAAVRIDERLIEVDYGELEGLDRARGEERFGEAFARWRSDPFRFPLPGMEPLEEALARASAATADALTGSRCPVLVGHQGILRLVLVALGEVERDGFFSVRLSEGEPMRVREPASKP
jgi:broad specificity phosphatase PhoE